MINFNLFFCSKNDDKLDRKEYQNAAILKEHVSLKIQEILDSISKEMQEQQKLFAQNFHDRAKKYKESLKKDKEKGIAFEGKVPIDVAIHTAELMEFFGSICTGKEVNELTKKIRLLDLIFNINTGLFTVFSILLFFFAFQIGQKEYYPNNGSLSANEWNESNNIVGSWDKLVVLSVILVPFIIIAIEKIFFSSRFTLKEFIENIDPERIGDLKKRLESSGALFCSILSAIILTSMLFVYLLSKYFKGSFYCINEHIKKDLDSKQEKKDLDSKQESTFFFTFQKIILLSPVFPYLVFVIVILLNYKFISDTNNIPEFNMFAKIYYEVLFEALQSNFSPSINTQKENTKPEQIEEQQQAVQIEEEKQAVQVEEEKQAEQELK